MVGHGERLAHLNLNCWKPFVVLVRISIKFFNTVLVDQFLGIDEFLFHFGFFALRLATGDYP
ncbi:MAG TPA: hypothetical protein DIV79_12395 [Opitutae bacterium]|nr:hypothetical protein [Opitutae bacterium]